MAKRAAVPKFGTWDSDNAGYTAYFDKVRENKGATAPPLQYRPHNPNDYPEEGPLMRVPPPSSSSSRPATASGLREPAPRRHHHGQTHHHHRRTDSSSSMASDPGARGAERSMFAPPPQYNPRPSSQPHHHQQQQQYQHHGGHHQHQHRPGGGGYRDRHAQQRQQHHAAAPAPRARSASPQSNAPSRQRPSAVPKFGVWDEQTAASAAQGFTVQFENVKRHRERARTAVPAVPRVASPPEGAAARHAHHQKTPFVSKIIEPTGDVYHYPQRPKTGPRATARLPAKKLSPTKTLTRRATDPSCGGT
ncbi:hypothetical protein U9M48_026897 [Paspalum notatum var. saurae]|uniref:RIN4 pathogenic type III effector avirulence factor Avr cleavage site domain-containing protein n=1 Tax=Paspalum notatum var. saurae TaxID=547442 RepID=A0AAQ3WZL9_PASNO